MNTCDNFRFEIWGHTYSGKKPYITIRTEAAKNDTDGLRDIWFVIGPEDMATFASPSGMISDGYHKLEVSGDRALFFDMEVPYKSVGKMEIRYRSIKIPYQLRKAIVRFAKYAIGKLPVNQEKLMIEPTHERIGRWERIYDHGSGEVHIDYGYDSQRTEEFIKECKAQDSSGDFDRRMEHITVIARNSTYHPWEKAKLRISKDLDGFYWEAYTPKGHRIMNGGLINHGKDKPDWSIHT